MFYKNIMLNSKTKMKDSLFICIKGDNYDSHDYANEAIKNGAIAVMSERRLDIDVLNIVVNDTKKELAYLASQFYNHPSLKFKLNAVTGTDGKTTTAIILKTILTNSAYIGTNGIMYNSYYKKTKNTTLNILDFNKELSKIPNNIKYICMEVSSKGIKDKRVYNLLFDRIIYTNITPEHLNEHIDFTDYKNTKLSLIDNLKDDGIVIVNADCNNLIEAINKSNKVFTYGINNKCNLYAINIKTGIDNVEFDLVYNDIIFNDFKVNLFGEYNIYNILGAISCAITYGINLDTIKKSLKFIPHIKGRMEKINYDNITYIVDFAHTPNALYNVLSELRKIKKANLIVVLGCGGNKDKTKRHKMGLIASMLSDFVIFSSDDPVDENPIDIIKEMKRKITKENHITILDRKKAIEYAVKISNSNDIIVVLGKGLENTMNYNNVLYFHNDLNEIKKSINKLKEIHI